MVEVDAGQVLKDFIILIRTNGVEKKQPIVYEFRPFQCAKCSKFGHTVSRRPLLRAKHVWVPQATAPSIPACTTQNGTSIVNQGVTANDSSMESHGADRHSSLHIGTRIEDRSLTDLAIVSDSGKGRDKSASNSVATMESHSADRQSNLITRPLPGGPISNITPLPSVVSSRGTNVILDLHRFW